MFNRLLIFAGAGISAESGLATFRGNEGLWHNHKVDEICNLHYFKNAKNDSAKRQIIFDFYNQRKLEILQAKPNNAHTLIAQWQKTHGVDRVRVFTSNIDDLFEKAGCLDIVHLHGDIYHMHCIACQHKWNVENELFVSNQRCPHCNSRLTKPHVVFFNEIAPEYKKLTQEFNLKRRKQKDIIIYIGSSSIVIAPSRLIQDKFKNNELNFLVNLTHGPEDDWFKYKFYGFASEQLLNVTSYLNS